MPLRAEGTWLRWQCRHTTHFPKLQHYWSLTIRLFKVITGHLLMECYPSAVMQSVYSRAPTDWTDYFN